MWTKGIVLVVMTVVMTGMGATVVHRGRGPSAHLSRCDDAR